MLIEKSLKGFKGGFKSTSKYECDMCKKSMTKEDRYLVSTSEKGRDVAQKRWDLCDKCMKIIEKNISIWYKKGKRENETK